VCQWIGFGKILSGGLGTVVEPLFKELQLCGFERSSFRGHAGSGIGAADALKQVAGGSTAGCDGGSCGAAGPHGSDGVQTQLGFLLQAAMAGEAAFFEQGFHSRVADCCRSAGSCDGVVRGLCGDGGCGQQQSEEQAGQGRFEARGFATPA